MAKKDAAQFVVNTVKRALSSDAEKLLPGVHFADPLKPATMRMSEALGNVGAEGKTLNFTEADRSRVFGSNRGGVGFSGLQHYSLPHQDANTVWGFGSKGITEKKVRQNDPEKNIWTTFVGAPTQHKSNTVVLQDAVKEFQKAVKAGKVHPAQIKLMNDRIRLATDEKTGALLFDEAYDLTDPDALSAANTFNRRSAVGDVLLGTGVKGPMRGKAFREESKGETWRDAGKMEAILKRETDPDLVDAETFDVGNRLFVMDNGIIHRPDLNVAFPYQVTGEDLGMKFELTPKDKAMRDWMKQYEGRKDKKGNPSPPSYMDLARNQPSQFVDEDYLTFLQKAGKKDGGAIHGDDQELKAMIADHLDSQSHDQELRAMVDNHLAGGGAPKAIAKGFKKLFSNTDAVVSESNSARLSREVGTPQGIKTLSFEDYTPNEVELVNLEALEQGRGYGSNAMNKIANAADKNKINMMLIPAGDDAKRARLSDFYGRFGFSDDGDVMRRNYKKADGGVIHMAGAGRVGRGIAKGFKSIFGGADEVAPVIQGGTRRFGSEDANLNIIKETGGNWLGGSAENALKPLRRLTPGGKDPVEAIKKLNDELSAPSKYGLQRPEYVSGMIGRLEQDAALNKWVDSNLTNYVKKQMSTAEDPVRKLAEEGITHLPQGTRMPTNMSSVKTTRQEAGFPEAMGTSPEAQVWEALSDKSVGFDTTGVMQNVGRGEPWMEKVDPFTRVHGISLMGSDSMVKDLGFDHVMDVLRQDVAAGRIRPEQLSKVSMEQAVRRTAEFDQEMAKRMAEAQIKNTAGMPTHKEYPDQGFKWIQLSQPEELPKGWSQEASGAYVGPNGERTIVNPAYQSLNDALKYEGDTMGHCVGSYCDDVAEGNSRIYSLRDAKGEPHVTVEVAPNPKPYPVSGEAFAMLPSKTKAEYGQYVREWRQRNPDVNELTDEHTIQALKEAGVKPQPDRIVQIKGKGNAKPKEEYLPFVQDFVKSGQWSDIGDLQNTGLRRTSDAFNDTEQEFLRNKGVDLKPYIEPEETARYQELFKQAPPAEGMAEGGGAFKTIPWAKPQNFDGGGIASPEEQSIGYSSEPSKMYKEVKQSLANDYDRLKSSARARAQYAKILAAQSAGFLADTASIVTPLINSEGLANAFPMAKMAMTGITGSPVLGKRESVLSNERKPYSLSDALSTKEGDPIGGSEHIIKKAQEAGLMYGKPINVLDENGDPVVDPQTGEPYYSHSGRFSPITEIGGSILGGFGLSKAGKGAVKAAQGFGKGFNRGYARAMSRQELPFLKELGYDSALDQQSVKLLGQQPEVTTALTGTPKGATYATKQDGPFYRVSPTNLDVSKAKTRGIREADELQGEADVGRAAGEVRGETPLRITDEEVGRLIADPATNEPLQIAKRYTKEAQGTDFTAPDIPESSLAKQSAIGRAHQLAVEGSPEYKTSVFDAYAREMPELLEQTGAKNYDDLMEKAYRQLAKETDDQFKQLPYNFSYHRAGEGDYLGGSKEMMADVHGNKHLYVFQGGDPHDFLNRIDKASGLNENEKFRAVHDLLGHAIYGNQFGPKGEEAAWAIHQQMYSPLARLAMTAETRGQNSLVNYSPLNAGLKSELSKYDMMADEAKRRGDTALVNEVKAAKRQAFSNFQFAPQKAVLLPPEFLDPKFAGGMPDYLSAANRPAKGTETESVLTHFSNDPNLQLVDPTRYGTGIKGAEAGRLRDFAGGVKDRSYFYLGEPGAISPEPGLGTSRYRGESSNLYDITKDPLEFRTLAREANRTPFTARANAGITSPLQEANDYERLVKEYGYEGMINPNASKPMGIMFKPTPVQPRAHGGLTQLRAR
jgi:hypothetical protein